MAANGGAALQSPYSQPVQQQPMTPMPPVESVPGADYGGGRHVTWDDQQPPMPPPQEPQPMQPQQPQAVALEVSRMKQLPIWAWILIIIGASVFAFSCGYVISRFRKSAAV